MTDPDLRRAILARVERLRPGTTCCPSEIARALADDWRPLMAPIRDEALRLQSEGCIQITQGGVQASGPDLHGPIRLGRPIPKEEHDA